MLVKNVNRNLLTPLPLTLLFVAIVAFPGSTVVADTNDPPQPDQPSVNLSQARRSKRRREPPSDYSRAGGSRGCPGEAIPLTVLAANTFVGKTTSVRPTFTWFVSKAQGTEFSLFELDTSKSTPKRIGAPIKLESRSGINTLSLPEEQAALTVGKKYIWQVSIDCPDSPFIQRAEFRIVQKPSVLDHKLSLVTNNSQKAYIYAKQDLWYEALREALKVAPEGKLGQVGSEIVQNLAQSDNLIPDKVTGDRLEVLKKEIQQRRNHLEKIAGGN